MILLDYSQISIAAILAFQREIKSASPEEGESIIRHAIISSILSNKKKFSKDYGTLVIAIDDRNYWRRDRFEHYKASRKIGREKSDIDWDFIFTCMNNIKDDLITNFPYKVIQVEKCEADDIIAVISKWTQTNDFDISGIEDISKKTLILSADHDFSQLHQYSNIRQYSPMQKKYIDKPKNVQAFINEHIANGDRGDGICNTLSPGDSFVNKSRQNTMRKDRLQEFIEHGIEACRTDTERCYWQRNELLVSFDMIPENISNNIIDTFTSCIINGSQGLIYKYFIKHNCRLLIDSIEEF